MEEITLSQIATTLALLAGIITSSGVIYHFVRKNIDKTLQSAFKRTFESTDQRLKQIEAKLIDIDEGACKNFMVEFLSKVELGAKADDEELERFWEVYDHYVKLGGNSYIKKKVEKLEHQGRI